MSMLKINDLRSYLENKSNQELIKEIVELAKQFPVIKEYYRTKVDPDFEIEIFEKYKKIIQDEFFHYKGFGKLKYSNINKAIRDFKKISKNSKLIAELMISYSEFGVEFMIEYGDVDEWLYNNILRSYINALDYIFKNGLEEKCKDRMNHIREDVVGVDWEFGDHMSEVYNEYFSDFDDEDE
ncbi:DUF6155 family protein [Clostridium sp. UBA1652]|uniref:DUF6155 family protein n=1 Tax=Clostridium sp. UBA1652 TaxID=1946348 RepID=UPI00257D89B9|nr:DUF6155 family protein [Clostridium sp. UBA1652]